MSGKVQVRLAVLAALAALVAVLVPSGLAAGDHRDDPNDDSYASDGLVIQDKGTLLLVMGTNDYFHWDEDSDGMVDTGENYEGVKLQKKNTCTSVISSSIPGSFGGTFADLVGDSNTPNVGAYAGSAAAPFNDSKEIKTGLIKDYFGASGPGETANGEPCGQANHPGEALAVKVSQSGPLAGVSMLRVDLDLEFKFSGQARFEFLDEDGNPVTYSHYRTSANGTPIAGTAMFDPMAATGDDGPDSADGDNYRVYLEPLIDVSAENENAIFDHVPFAEIVIIPTSGAVSLGGGDDLDTGDSGNKGLIADTFFSEFDLALAFDGEITCGDTETIGTQGVDTTVGVVTMHSMNIESGGWDANCLRLKPFTKATSGTALSFAPVDPDAVARYTWVVTVEDQPIVIGAGGVITSLQSQYNLAGDLSGVKSDTQSCNGQPILDVNHVDYSDYWEQDAPVIATNGSGDPFYQRDASGDLELDNGNPIIITDGSGSAVLDANDAPVPLLPGSESFCSFGKSVSATGADVGTETHREYFEVDPAGFY